MIDRRRKEMMNQANLNTIERTRLNQLRTKERGQGLSVKELSELGRLQEKASPFARAEAAQAPEFFKDVPTPGVQFPRNKQ